MNRFAGRDERAKPLGPWTLAKYPNGLATDGNWSWGWKWRRPYECKLGCHPNGWYLIEGPIVDRHEP